MRAGKEQKAKANQSAAANPWAPEEDQFDDGMEREVPAINRQRLTN